MSRIDTAHWSPPLPADALQRPALQLDLSAANPTLASVDVADSRAFGQWIDAQCRNAGCAWALGGYGEDRVIYGLSPLFGGEDSARSVHLGVDFWLTAGTPVHAVADGTVHSLGDNALFGDYGGTVLIAHEHGGLVSLYGHLAPRSLAGLRAGQAVQAGQTIGALGTAEENVGWPPHLHFQLIRDVGDYTGDFPGVCAADEAEAWLLRCPDPMPPIRRWCPHIVTE